MCSKEHCLENLSFLECKGLCPDSVPHSWRHLRDWGVILLLGWHKGNPASPAVSAKECIQCGSGRAGPVPTQPLLKPFWQQAGKCLCRPVSANSQKSFPLPSITWMAESSSLPAWVWICHTNIYGFFSASLGFSTWAWTCRNSILVAHPCPSLSPAVSSWNPIIKNGKQIFSQKAILSFLGYLPISKEVQKIIILWDSTERTKILESVTSNSRYTFENNQEQHPVTPRGGDNLPALQPKMHSPLLCWVM